MTDRHAGYVVVLEENIREDDAAATITALRMVKGVVDVRPVVGDLDLAIASSRVDERWRRALRNLANGRTEPPE